MDKRRVGLLGSVSGKADARPAKLGVGQTRLGWAPGMGLQERLALWIRF